MPADRDELVYMMDITRPENVEIEINHQGTVWVNIDGICRLRICRPHNRVLVTDGQGEKANAQS